MAQTVNEPLPALAASAGLEAACLPPYENSRKTSPNLKADVVIVGGGLAGTLTALVLGRRGLRVTITDQHAIYPREFRCEKLSPQQMDLMRDLGIIDDVADVTHPFNNVLVARGGRLSTVREHEERGFAYSNMVNKLRSLWPEKVSFIQGRVAEITASPDLQQVRLAGGDIGPIEARLAVLATGPSDALAAALGFKRRSVRPSHSFSIGFGMTPKDGGSFPFEALTYFGERAGDRIGYATFFPQLQGMRVNLFSYHERDAAWLSQFKHDPAGKLFELMPGLAPLLGDFDVTMPVEIRPSHLYHMEQVRHDGIVLIGDAFQSSCPASGTGVTRVLMDVRQLCLVHLPGWLSTPGIGADKIARFYDDPAKRVTDRGSLRTSERGRNLAVRTSLRWRIERWLRQALSRFPATRKLLARRHGLGRNIARWAEPATRESVPTFPILRRLFKPHAL